MASAPENTPIHDDELAALFQLLEASRRIILAVSGGVDSTALMVLFARWARQIGPIGQYAVHPLVITVDHGLRAEAAAEARLVARQAGTLGFSHRTLCWIGDKPAADLQNAARIARYKLLRQAAETEGADTIVTAHTRDDQAETFLLALARGSGVYGLAAMPPARDEHGIRLVRPLLSMPKSRLIATLETAGIGWSEDPSNQNPRFRRIAMRAAGSDLSALGLTPATLAATADRMARAASALDVYADRLIAAAAEIHLSGYIQIDLEQFKQEPDEVALRAFARLLRALSGGPHVTRLDRLERLFAGLIGAAQAGKSFKRTLGDIVAHLPQRTRATPRPSVWLYAEAGRTGFARDMLVPGETLEWDCRFRLVLSATAASPLRIEALGASGRAMLGPNTPGGVPAAALGTVPAIWRDDVLVGVPGITPDVQLRAYGVLTAQSLVADRLARSGTYDTGRAGKSGSRRG